MNDATFRGSSIGRRSPWWKSQPCQMVYYVIGAFLLATLLAHLTGCAGRALPGKLYDLTDATTLDFEIETSRGTGDMRATNPKTGERFAGQYTGVYTGGGLAVGSAYNQRLGTTTGTAYAPPTGANARGVLIGDRGTMIELYLDIRPGIRPKGHGTGTDNQGRRYQVQF